MTTSLERQMWLEKAVLAFRDHFQENGYTIPANVRVSIGIPKGMHGAMKAIGQCWSDKATSDGYYEIFCSPEQHNEEIHLATLAHELVHATVGLAVGHKGLFRTCATDIGLAGKMTATIAGDKLKPVIKNIVNSLGYYPAGRLDASMRKKKATYMLKCECPNCGYTVRTTATWLAVGDPICPVDKIPMES